MLSKEEATRIFIDSGALMEGHFRLTSGRHSNQYMQCAQVLQYPRYTEQLAAHIAEKFAADNIEIVVGPAMGGIIVAYEVARQLGIPAIFTERQEGSMVLRRGFELRPGQRVLVVEDVITTGGSVWEVIELVQKAGAVLAGVAVLVDRSNGEVDFKVKQEAVLTIDIKSFEAADCPICREGKLPVIKPGSRA
ncbi:MAG: orotate phosphoribosyltransferase [Syntrophomonas sp.]|uniref:orotate phosphoribosyltransferase n=1 Tax=Syntrophomonas sp. TaxID=2053627 RepID=UPI0026022C7B|nr:orotate phosphoribosyltransferase [Syntrophomonas sp.]MDD2511404.1 orotate phosphoribosyltransferase [Syntrophomonas sp.]MDD4627708.1 orotate phosphoribosyltransferase [Syntrophomonas sp.]